MNVGADSPSKQFLRLGFGNGQKNRMCRMWQGRTLLKWTHPDRSVPDQIHIHAIASFLFIVIVKITDGIRSLTVSIYTILKSTEFYSIKSGISNRNTNYDSGKSRTICNFQLDRNFKANSSDMAIERWHGNPALAWQPSAGMATERWHGNPAVIFTVAKKIFRASVSGYEEDPHLIGWARLVDLWTSCCQHSAIIIHKDRFKEDTPLSNSTKTSRNILLRSAGFSVMTTDLVIPISKPCNTVRMLTSDIPLNVPGTCTT